MMVNDDYNSYTYNKHRAKTKLHAEPISNDKLLQIKEK